MDDASSKNKHFTDSNSKQDQLDQFRIRNNGKALTTNQGKKLSNDEEQLKAGVRGPALRQDYEFFEKMTHFAHEFVMLDKKHFRTFTIPKIFHKKTLPTITILGNSSTISCLLKPSSYCVYPHFCYIMLYALSLRAMQNRI